jgi:glycosyltransferase involved in cell wall biosynthesis
MIKKASIRLSVGIPTFNQGDFLEETILSLLNQTRPPDEIIISDHYSTDQTPDIIKKYAAHVRGVKPPAGVNLTGQYNFTLASQTGDWITLLSSDDLARPHYCELLARGAASDPDAVIVRTGWENIDEEGKVLNKQYMLSVPKVESSPSTLISQRHGPRVSFASFAVKRAAYLRSGPILGEIESLSDWALFAQIAPYGNFIYVDEIGSGYRVGHDGNKFRDRLGMWIRDEIRMFTEVFPLAAERAGLGGEGEQAWIAKASRANFLRYLEAACEEFEREERSDITPLFEAWAALTGCQKMLESFAAGNHVSQPINLPQYAKRMIRPLVQNLVSLLHCFRSPAPGHLP